MNTVTIQKLLDDRLEKLMRLEKAYTAPTRVCPPAYLLTPPDGTDLIPELAPLAGKQVFVGMMDTWMQLAHIQLGGNGFNTVVVPLEWITQTAAHDFPNTGTQRSWCAHCGATGRFNWRSGKFETQ